MALGELITELRRRRVFRAAGLYIVAAWVAIQVADLVFPAINVPDAALLYVWLCALFLFPLVLVFAWFFDVSVEGLTRTPGAHEDDSFDPSLRAIDYAELAALFVVAVAIAWQLSTRIERPAELGHSDVNPLSLAVLPLDDLTGDPDQQYFVSGMHSGLIAALSRVRALRVTSKTSTLGVRGSGTSLPEIGALLSVAKIIEGSIYRFGNRVRLGVQLLDARTDEHIWSATFEDEVEDILVLQSRVAQAIAQQVRVTLSAGEQALFDHARGVNVAAHEAFLKGEFYVEQFTPQGFQLAAEHYRQAVELDPDNPLAHWGFGKLCAFKAQAGLLEPMEARRQCLAHTARALELDPLLAEAHLGRAVELTWRYYDWEEAEAAFEKAIEINPSYAEARMFYSHYLGIVGRLDESTEQMRIARELDPLNPFLRGLQGVQLIMLGEYEEAVALAEEAIAMAPGFAFAHLVTWRGYFRMHDYDKSIAGLANSFGMSKGEEGIAEFIERTYDGNNYRETMRQLAEHLLEKSKTRYVPLHMVAYIYDHAGETEKAIDWYETAFREYDPDSPYFGVVSRTEDINRNPRFQQLLRDMKLDYWADRFSSERR